MTKETFLRIDEVSARVGLSRSTIYRLVEKGLFPKPVRIGPKSVRWQETSIDTWMAAKIEHSGGQA